jgi:hypothetical protein
MYEVSAICDDATVPMGRIEQKMACHIILQQISQLSLEITEDNNVMNHHHISVMQLGHL